MRSLSWSIAPVGLCLFLPLLGCTGVGPFNWAQIDQPYQASRDAAQLRRSPLMADAQYEMPLEQAPANRLLARGRIREHWNRARGYEQAGETEQAAAHYQEILRLEPRYAPAHHRLGVLATMWGRFGDADQHFRLARMLNKPEQTEEELYATQSAASEREAEQRLAREIAAEKSLAAKSAGQRGYTRHALPAAEQGEAMDAEAYYAQSERPLKRMRTAVRQRTSEWMAPVSSRFAARPESIQGSHPEEVMHNTRSRIVRDGNREYDLDDDEAYYDEQEVETNSEPEFRRATREPQPAVRRTSVPVRSTKSQPDSNHTTQLRKNQLRAEHRTDQYVAGAEDRTPVVHDTRSEHATATTGFRRRTAQEPDRFEEELPEVWEATARVEKQGTVVQTKATTATVTARDKAIAKKAAEIEKAVEQNVQRQVTDSLAERKIELARQELHRAQQQLVEAMLAAEQSGELTEQPTSSQTEEQVSPERPTRSRLPLPAPRRLRSSPSAALDAEDQLELAEVSTEPQQLKRAPAKLINPAVLQAAANAPAEAASNGSDDSQSTENNSTDVEVTSKESASTGVIQTSHVEELEEVKPSAEEINPGVMRELYEYSESAAPETSQTVHKSPQSVLPQTRAHQPERAIHSLDETTLHRRKIQPRSSFQKKAPAAPESLLYR